MEPDKFITEGKTLDETRAAVLEHLKKNGAPMGSPLSDIQALFQGVLEDLREINASILSKGVQPVGDGESLFHCPAVVLFQPWHRCRPGQG